MKTTSPTPWSTRRTRLARLALALCLPLLCAACIAGAPARSALAGPAAQAEPAGVPLLAYYYIWFDPRSWDRAKTDLPQLGAYSSDDRQVMQQHIQWAKQAGITGFVVSWKSTEQLNRRLKQLIEVANHEQFKLLIIYQGLDFERNPLPPARIAADLDYFTQTFAADPVFDLFERPVVIWSGTWKFTPEQIADVTATRRQKLLILASERSEDAYQRIAGLVDGDAYYWSSVNPETFPNYAGKLAAMAAAVHAGHGLWIAPAAVGFDARLIGGTQVVERKDGETLRRQLNAAQQSSPDAVGLISWNEFSENSYIEPSRAYGRRYLDVLASMQYTGVVAPAADLDSSMPGDVTLHTQALAPLAILAGLIVVSSIIMIWRSLSGARHGAQARLTDPDGAIYDYTDEHEAELRAP
jgi:hypothetical protein